MSIDPYVYPGSDVLRNIPGYQNVDEWRQAEADFTRIRIARLRRMRVEGRYDLAHLQAFHRFIFDGFYAWAGELRTVDIAMTAPFCHVRFLRTSATSTFARLPSGLLSSPGHEEYVDRLALHFANVNALHPFREGNGRAQRAFFAQIADDAGYEIDWASVDADRNDAASRASLSGNEALLRELLAEITKPRVTSS